MSSIIKKERTVYTEEDIARKKAYYLNREMYNVHMCKNQHYVIVEVDEEIDSKIEKVEKIINDGCKNLRRDGSAYCQECSDKHDN